MKKLILAAGVASAVFATPAFAQDSAAPSGVRVEAILGYDRVSYDLEDTFGIDDSLHMSGVLYGVGLGYDFPVSGNVALGIDLEASDSTSDRKEEFSGDVGGVDVDGSAKIAAGRDLYVGARFTAAVSPKFNVYVKGGYTNARLKASAEGTVDGEHDEISDAANGDGFRLGAGAQYAIGQKSFFGVEYRYSNYEYDFSRNQVAATFGFRF